MLVLKGLLPSTFLRIVPQGPKMDVIIVRGTKFAMVGLPVHVSMASQLLSSTRLCLEGSLHFSHLDFA